MLIPQVKMSIQLKLDFFLQIIEMRVIPPSAPQNLAVEESSLTFSSPIALGGSHILCYEVSLATTFNPKIEHNDQVHLKPIDNEDWFYFQEIPVQQLSWEPNIKPNFFTGLSGSFFLRVCAKNRAGRGTCSEEILVKFEGWSLKWSLKFTKQILKINQLRQNPIQFSLLSFFHQNLIYQ